MKLLFYKSKQYLITGFISIIPIALTYFIFNKLFYFFSNPGANFLYLIFDENIPDYIPQLAGFIITISIVYLIGLFISNILGKKIYDTIDLFFYKIPIINTIYKTIKQITSNFSNPNKQAFKKVIYIEYPKSKIWTMAMVTGESKNDNGDEFYHIFVPTTPNPTSGFMLYILKEDVYETNIPIDEGLKIIISGGMLGPNKNKINNVS